MKKEGNCACLYISYSTQQVFLWILRTSGAVSLQNIKVNENTLTPDWEKLLEIWMNFLLSWLKAFVALAFYQRSSARISLSMKLNRNLILPSKKSLKFCDKARTRAIPNQV